MNIRYDGTTVTFKTEPKALFEAEKSGAKQNTVRILDIDEYHQLRKHNPKKIIIQYQQEIFLRTITNLHVTEGVFGKVIVVISWTNEEHHHAMPSEPGPGDHDMSLDLAEVCPRNCEKATTTVKIEPEGEPPLQVQAINISLSLLKLVDKYRGDKTYDQFVRTLLANFYVDTIEASPGRSIKTNEIPLLSTTARCPSCEGDILKARQREFGKCIICGAIYRLNQDNEDELIVTIKTLKCPNCDCEGSILLLKTREGDKASKYGKCYKCGFTYRLDQRGNFYHG